MTRWLLLLSTLLVADDAFITPREYAVQLYHNPRGIGCQLCHGEQGEGKLIAHYFDEGVKKAFTAPAINVLTYDAFEQALERRIKGMPKYYLTAGERKALYRYLHPEYKDQNVSQ